MTSQKQATFKTKRLKDTVDVLKMIKEKLKSFKKIIHFETGNNDLIAQTFRREYNVEKNEPVSCFIDYPVNEDLRIGFYIEFINLNDFKALLPFLENVLMVLSEKYE